MLLLHKLQTVLQAHYLVHVVVLRHGVVLLCKLFFIKLHKLCAAPLLEALQHIVAIPRRLRHRRDAKVVACQEQLSQGR